MEPNIEKIRDKWFINLSSKAIPPRVVALLQLGEKFCLPPNNNKQKYVMEFIKDIELNIKNLTQDTKAEIRSHIFPSLDKFYNSNTRLSDMDTSLLKLYKETKLFIKHNPDIIFTRADKGNTTVALDGIDYLRKIDDLLSDTSTYTVITKNPIKKIESDLISLLKNWKSKNYIPHSTYRS